MLNLIYFSNPFDINFFKKLKVFNLCIKKNFKRHFNFLLIGEQGKSCCVLIKFSDTFMYNHTLHPLKEYFCYYCLQALSATEILESHINICFRISGKQMIQMPKKGEYVRFIYFENKIKLQFIIHTDSEE